MTRRTCVIKLNEGNRNETLKRNEDDETGIECCSMEINRRRTYAGHKTNAEILLLCYYCWASSVK